MGLIVEVIAQHNPLHVCTDGSSSSPYEEAISFDKTIYRVLSMQDDMKTLTYPATIKNEFDLFIQTASAKTDSLPYNATFESLNEYLGTIGVTNGIC